MNLMIWLNKQQEEKSTPLKSNNSDLVVDASVGLLVDTLGTAVVLLVVVQLLLKVVLHVHI